MIIKLTNTDAPTLFINDVGPVRTPKLTREGKTLKLNDNVTLDDSPENLESFTSGELKAAIDRGDVQVVTAPIQPTQNFSTNYTATALQTIFNLPAGMSYVPGNKSLHVYVAGSLQPKPGSLGATYAETSATRITFSVGVDENDDVQLIWSK